MARTATGGQIPVGGRRRPGRRPLPAILVLAAVLLAPAAASASTSADAWMSAQLVHRTHAEAIGQAAQELTDGGSEREIRELRRTVATAVRAIDRLEVHACFQVWWSYVRSSYVLFDQALIGMESQDLAHVRSAAAASQYLSARAASMRVDCPRDEGTPAADIGPGPREPLPLVDMPGLPAG